MRFFTFPALLAAALISAVIALAATLFLASKRNDADFFAVEARMASTVDGFVQLYYDSGPGIREENSVRLPIAAGPAPRLYRLILPAGRYTAFRFDPLDRPGTVTIESLRVAARSARVLRPLVLTNLTPTRQIASLRQTDRGLETVVKEGADDPQFVFTLSPPLEVRVTLSERLAGFFPRLLGGFAVLAALLFVLDPPARVHGFATRAAGRLAAWWRKPRALVWVLGLATLLLVLRKSWALSTPQLWAEDGSVHLNENDRWGAGAFLLPYRGYLHTIPRLVAWLASHTADVAYWPALYNGAALLVAVLLLVRLASPRLELPGKPWLILSFVLVQHSGEIFLNITNLHWLTGFFLVLQALIARPTTPWQRAGDYAIIVLAGLTDPSAIIFLPLFAWRWWRERHADNLAVLLVVGACASIQAYFLATTGPHFGADTAPLQLLRLVEMAACRLIIWPFLGADMVAALPAVAQAVIACAVVAALALWALRPDRHRPLRVKVWAAWGMITFATVYRIRPDQWEVPFGNLGYAEPYFYMSRLLLVWLVIWEFDTQPRLVAVIARVACFVSVLLALPGYREPAPADYHWADLCDPIRRGVPANIPILPGGWILQYGGRPPLP